MAIRSCRLGGRSQMTEGPIDRDEALFSQAADLPPEQQRALLDASCEGDPGLRARMERLLADDARLRTGVDAAGFLNSPLVRLKPVAEFWKDPGK